ncbi:MAG: hypothetical protein WCA19_25595 [Candidatus Acidiferrales bacterium]
MCEIGRPLEVIDSQPLSPPAPLRWETEQPAEQPVTVEIPVAEEVPAAEGATVSPVAGTEGTAFPLF